MIISIKISLPSISSIRPKTKKTSRKYKKDKANQLKVTTTPSSQLPEYVHIIARDTKVVFTFSSQSIN